MYAFVRESGHDVRREQWYILMSRVSLRTDFYMIREDYVFIANVVITDPMREMVATSVICRLVGVITKLHHC
jgi:hypothetical protein